MSSTDNRVQDKKGYQVHYHYHYYDVPNPQHESIIRDREKLSKSQVYYGKREDENNIEGERQEEQQSECQKTNRNRERSFKKMRSSNCWSSQNTNTEIHYQQKQAQTPEISLFTAQEELTSAKQDKAATPLKQFDKMNETFGTQVSDKAEKNVIVAQYQSQLNWYKQQVERLKQIEQQCIYLRESCLMHYQKCQKERRQ